MAGLQRAVQGRMMYATRSKAANGLSQTMSPIDLHRCRVLPSQTVVLIPACYKFQAYVLLLNNTVNFKRTVDISCFLVESLPLIAEKQERLNVVLRVVSPKPSIEDSSIPYMLSHRRSYGICRMPSIALGFLLSPPGITKSYSEPRCSSPHI